MGRAGLNRKTALATLTLTLAAEAPDLDVLARVKGPAFSFAHHRGFTHSLLGVPLVAIVVVAFVYLVWRFRKRKSNDPNIPPRWGLLFVYACLAGLSHILLDFTNNYGVRPFWPFSERWYSWDIVFIVEPVMLGFLFLGLVVPGLFALVDKEIGARPRGPRGRLAASLALIGVALMWGIRDYEHRRAVHALDARTYNGSDPLRVSAYPHWITPFTWDGVVETPTVFALAPVNSLAPEVDPAGELFRQLLKRVRSNLARLETRRNGDHARRKEIVSGSRVFGLGAVPDYRNTNIVGRRIHRPFSGSALRAAGKRSGSRPQAQATFRWSEA